jgi:UDP-glucose 4-epimerase
MGKKPIPADIIRKNPETGDHAIYSICKNTAVELIEHYYYQYKIKRFILRLPTIYAYHPNNYFYVNGDKKPIGYKFIINRAIRGEPVEVWGDPTKSKEITYIGDLNQIIENAIKSNLDGGVYNVGRGIGVSLDEQIKGIIEIFSPKEHQSEIIYRPDMPNAREIIHDISKTEKDLGYKPKYDYMKLLKAYKAEMESGRFKDLWGEEKDYE